MHILFPLNESVSKQMQGKMFQIQINDVVVLRTESVKDINLYKKSTTIV